MRKRTSECRTAEIGPGGSPERHRIRAGYRDAVRQLKTIGGWRQKVSRRSDPTYSAPRNANLSNNPHRRNICFAHERHFAEPMSALGHKQTYAVHNVMSALGQKRTWPKQKDRLPAVSPKNAIGCTPVNRGTQTGPCKIQG